MKSIFRWEVKQLEKMRLALQSSHTVKGKLAILSDENQINLREASRLLGQASILLDKIKRI